MGQCCSATTAAAAPDVTSMQPKIDAANAKAIELRSDAEKECKTIMDAAASGPWTDEMKTQFIKFTSYVSALAGEAKWTFSVQEIMELPEYATVDAFVKAQCVSWYDAYLRTQLSHQTLNVWVSEVADRARLNQYGFFTVVDNRGKIVYPSAATLNSLCNFSIDEHLRQQLVTRENVGQFLTPIEFNFAPELKLESCKICFVSFETTGIVNMEIREQDRTFFQNLSTLPGVFNEFLKEKRESPSDVSIALSSLTSLLGSDLVKLIPSPWSAVTKTGGDAVVGILQKLSEKTTVEFTFLDWAMLNGCDASNIGQLHKQYRFCMWKNKNA